MKTRTQAFKNTIKEYGRELDSIITYESSGETIELGNEQLNSISPHYEGGILKSVMKVLDIDSNEDIPLGTIINYQFGVKVREELVNDYRDNYDYIDFGNYVVYKSEKQEDSDSYKITCYDKILYSMKEYEALNITYPISIRDYINAIASYMDLTFANASDTFANYNKMIPNELYLDSQGNSLGYTFRDVLDELAEVTASTICINANDELEVRYINNTGDTIDANYLKDINVNFGEQYGAINTIVLSRNGADKIYASYPSDLPEEDRISIEIADNQIMNRNDRDSYLSDILSRLNGLTYYLNDFSSTGICYYDLCDRYNITIDNNNYSCVMLNDDIQVTTGLEENVYTEMPEESVTDYTKADTTDRRINQTYLIVDKQNQTIQSVVSNVGEQDEKISQITQTVNELNSKISDIADITTSNETTMATMDMNDINASEPIQIKVYPIGENISYIYPSNYLYPTTQHYPAKEGLKPSNTLTPSSTLVPSTGYPEQNIIYPKIRTIRFHNNTTSEDIDYVLPDDLLYYDSNNYDEFTLDYGDGTPTTKICQVIKRCKYNVDGTVSLLTTPETHNYTYPTINLTDGDYTISILSYNNGYIFARLMAKNIYTTQFYTKAETNSIIVQTASSIDLSVNQKLSNYSTTNEMNSAINIKANQITSSVSETYATKTTTNQLSSRISQTAKDITLSVNNGSTTSGITIGITKEDGTTSQASGTIEMNGLVKFTNLTDGQTTISGSNITTGTINGNNVNVTNISASNITSGTINGNNVNVTNINASNITSGTLSANKISGGSITASSINLGNGKFRVTTGGAITSTSGNIGGWTIGSSTLYGGSGSNYVEISPGGVSTPNISKTWVGILSSTSDKRAKNTINDIDEKYEEFYDNLKPKTYKYNKDMGLEDYDKLRFGFIAQDILENKDAQDLAMVWGDKLLQLDKQEIIALNTWQIQKLKIQVKEQQEIIEGLTKRIEKLERNDK